MGTGQHDGLIAFEAHAVVYRPGIQASASGVWLDPDEEEGIG